jgi:hypothetical protein
MTLPPDLLRARRRKGRITPVYAGEDKASLAKTLISVYQDHIGKTRAELAEALSHCEELGYDSKLVRGLSAVLDEGCIFETCAAIDPMEARRVVFGEAADRVITSGEERRRVLEETASTLGVSIEELDGSLYADLEDEQRLTEFEAPAPEGLLKLYNFSLAVALLTHARRLTIRYEGENEYLSRLAGAERTTGKAKTIKAELKGTRRLAQRGAKMGELLAELMDTRDWSLQATIAYPARLGKMSLFELSKREEGNLLMKPRPRTPDKGESVIEIGPPRRKARASSFGKLVVLEEAAQRMGLTEAEVRRRIDEEGAGYADLGGVLIEPGELRELREAIEGLGDMRLETVSRVLREHGCRSPLPVLEALGYAVEWVPERRESMVYRLGGRATP